MLKWALLQSMPERKIQLFAGQKTQQNASKFRLQWSLATRCAIDITDGSRAFHPLSFYWILFPFTGITPWLLKPHGSNKISTTLDCIQTYLAMPILPHGIPGREVCSTRTWNSRTSQTTQGTLSWSALPFTALGYNLLIEGQPQPQYTDNK